MRRVLLASLMIGCAAPRPTPSTPTTPSTATTIASTEHEKKTVPAAPSSPPALPTPNVKLRVDRGALIADIDFRSIIDERTRQRLENGLPVELLLRIYLVETSSGAQIASVALGCRVMRDLWNDRFDVNTLPGAKRHLRKTADVASLCLRFEGIPLVSIQSLVSGSRYQGVAISAIGPTYKVPSFALLAGSPQPPPMPPAGTLQEAERMERSGVLEP